MPRVSKKIAGGNTTTLTKKIANLAAKEKAAREKAQLLADENKELKGQNKELQKLFEQLSRAISASNFSQPTTAGKKRGRGRPRKAADSSVMAAPVKRGRGRPRKAADSSVMAAPVKRGRGRPRKNPV